MKAKIFGIGAAGNKGTINLIEKEIVPKGDVMLLNSTLRDVPANYRAIAKQYNETDARGGCGKERDAAKDLALEYLQSERSSEIDEFIGKDTEFAIINESTEGGTGCGSAEIIGEYAYNVHGIRPMLFAFSGFEEDGRGLQNTIEFFQDINDSFTVQCISNKKFLDRCNGNKLKAEKMANDDFARRVAVVLGRGMVDSEQNIDDTDMFKVVTTPGFMVAKFVELKKIKNVNQFNSILKTAIDEDESVDTSKSAKRIAVIMNISEETRDCIDYSFSVLKEKYGTPYELFQHIQYEENQPEYISFIIAGLEMPIDEVKEILKKYEEESSKVNKKKDSFFSFMSGVRGNDEDAMFNVGRTSGEQKMDKSAFLNKYKKNQNAEITEQDSNKPKGNPDVETIKKEDFLKKY